MRKSEVINLVGPCARRVGAGNRLSVPVWVNYGRVKIRRVPTITPGADAEDIAGQPPALDLHAAPEGDNNWLPIGAGRRGQQAVIRGVCSIEVDSLEASEEPTLAG